MQTKQKIIIGSFLLMVIIYTAPCKADNTTPSASKSCSYDKESDVHTLTMQGHELSEQEVEKLEKKLVADPNDVISRTTLLGWYMEKSFFSTSARKKRQEHILWIIKNCPDSPIAGAPEAGLDPHLDGETYHKAKQLWLKQTKSNSKNTSILSNAASFFLIQDKDIAEKILKQAQAIEPNNPDWFAKLALLYKLETAYPENNSKKDLAAKSLKQYVKSLNLTKTEREKFYLLADVAKAAFEAGESEKAKSYANQLLSLAARYKNDWNYGNAIHHGNIILGRLALSSGDIENAKKYLIEAGKTPGSPQLNSFGPNMSLAKELLEKNEKEIVIEYFQLCANFWKLRQKQLKNWTTLVKEGIIPDFGGNLLY